MFLSNCSDYHELEARFIQLESKYSTGQKKVKVPNGRCGSGAVAVRYLYARGTLEVRLKYAQGTRSRCGRGTLEVRSRYA